MELCVQNCCRYFASYFWLEYSADFRCLSWVMVRFSSQVLQKNAADISSVERNQGREVHDVYGIDLNPVTLLAQRHDLVLIFEKHD